MKPKKIVTRYKNSDEEVNGPWTDSTVCRIGILLTLYFIQGLPFGLQEKFLPVYFRIRGYDYTHIFLFRFIHIPWLCKMLWAPFVDKIENKDKCIIFTLFLLSLGNLTVSLMDPDNYTRIGVAMFLMNFVVSLQDIALDTFAMSFLRDSELGNGNSAQVIGYKIGMAVGSAGFAFVASYGGLQSVFIFLATLQLGAVGCFFLIGNIPTSLSASNSVITECKYGNKNMEICKKSFSKTTPEETSNKLTVRKSSDEKDKWNYKKILEINGTCWLILFLFTYKLGEAGVLSMFPLYLIDSGVNKDIVLWWNAVIGHGASVLGSVIGGQLSSNRKAVFHNLVKFSTIRCGLIFALTLIVVGFNEPLQTSKNHSILAFCLGILMALSFVSGLVTTVTFTLMMISSKRAPIHSQAFYYSTLSTMEVAGKLSFMIVMGPVVDHYGENFFFLLCLIISVIQLPMLFKYPGMLKS